MVKLEFIQIKTVKEFMFCVEIRFTVPFDCPFKLYGTHPDITVFTHITGNQIIQINNPVLLNLDFNIKHRVSKFFVQIDNQGVISQGNKLSFCLLFNKLPNSQINHVFDNLLVTCHFLQTVLSSFGGFNAV